MAAVTLKRPFLLLLRDDVSSLSPIGMPATDAAFVPSTTVRSVMMSNSSGWLGSWAAAPTLGRCSGSSATPCVCFHSARQRRR